MNEQKRIKYIKELSDNGLRHEITDQDIKFLIDIADRLGSFASEFDPVLTEGQMNAYAEAYKVGMLEGNWYGKI